MQPVFRKVKLLLILLLLLSVRLATVAQVSLLPEHSITIDGVTLIRDSHNSGKWYYVPEKPVLQERSPANKEDPRPVFQLVTYQAKKDSEIYEGGLLQFAVTLHLPEAARKKIENKLKSHPEAAGNQNISLAPLPFHKAEAFMFDADGKKYAAGTQAPGFSPAYITGALPFQIKLDRFEADLYKALTDSRGGGAGVLMNLTFEGLLPPAGFKVTIDWDQTYSIVSKSSDLKISLGNYFLGVDVGVSKTKIREELISRGCMTVESLTGESAKPETIDRYLDPVIVRMQQAIIEKIHPPGKIDAESRSKPDSLSKCFFGLRVGVSVDLKDISQARKGKETFEFSQSAVVERSTSCGAFIGVNKYSDKVKNNLVRVMPLDSWASAFLLLPGVETNPELHIQSVSMTANVVDSDGKEIAGLSDTASWAADNRYAWKNRDGKETGSLQFPLMALFKLQDNKIAQIRREYSFKVDVVIEQSFGPRTALNTVEISYLSPMFDGDLPLPAAVDLVDNVVFDLSAVTFDEKEGLKKAKIQLKRNNQKIGYTFSPDSEERSVVFIVPALVEGNKKPEILVATISFDIPGQKVANWAHNGKDLRKVEPSLYFMLFDSDWQH